MTVYVWRVRTRLPERFGTRCRVLARGTLNSCLVEFVSDGYRVVTSRNLPAESAGGSAVRRCPTCQRRLSDAGDRELAVRYAELAVIEATRIHDPWSAALFATKAAHFAGRVLARQPQTASLFDAEAVS